MWRVGEDEEPLRGSVVYGTSWGSPASPTPDASATPRHAAPRHASLTREKWFAGINNSVPGSSGLWSSLGNSFL
ncbi:hypothetical protein E2C01_070171 [Portunus trituberculatus]|uniref:Uncharacterized protein n=1 Tax=Portunus trituberculatus TaxID=210409 RepID=A0A5B7I1E9_PORTR|nr:hypothetical protein [Portunus trituberculatus]